MSEEPFVCIRSIGERTEKCLLKQVEEEISKSNITLVSENPLSATLKKGFMQAIEKGNRWTIHIDADVLLIPGALKGMTKKLSQLGENVFAAQFLVADYLLGDIRYAGNGAYRTDFLPMTLPYVEESREKIRPVRHVIKRMEEKGFRFIDLKEEIIGIHDAEQYYRDIYRKGFVYAFKHLNKAAEFISYWRQKENTEFLVAKKGFADGIMHTGSVRIDPNIIDNQAFEKWLLQNSIQEKTEFSNLSEHDLKTILNAILDDHYEISKQKKVYRWISPQDLR